MGIDLLEWVGRFLARGIKVDAGMMLGFDADTRETFEQQYEFAMASPIPIFMIHPLVAPESTPLYERMAAESRLVNLRGELLLHPGWTNMHPRQMSRQELFEGYRWLCNRLYRPEAFGERMVRFVECFRPRVHRQAMAKRPAARPVDTEVVQVAGRVLRLGPREEAMMARITKHVAARPAATSQVLWLLG